MKKDSKIYKIFIIAGEASGDMLGGKLISALKELHPNLKIKAIGGENIKDAGSEIVFDCKEIAVMGFVEILPKLFKILVRMKQALRSIEKFNPDILITIDSPGFNFRIVEKLRKKLGKKFPILHYVAPSVWAYKKERAVQVAKLYDHILLLLPFEKPYFDEVGLKATFVGHPLIEDLKLIDKIESLKVSSDVTPILLMPGSRAQEIKRMGVIFKEALMLFEDKYSINLMIMIPTKPSLEKLVREIFSNMKNVIISIDSMDKLRFFKRAKLALVKSGTSSLEMAIHKIPCVVAYKMSVISYLYIKSLIKIPYISLVNILLNKKVIPELIQHECTPKNLAKQLANIVSGTGATKMKSSYLKVIKLLQNDSKVAPSRLAAQAVLKILKK